MVSQFDSLRTVFLSMGTQCGPLRSLPSLHPAMRNVNWNPAQSSPQERSRGGDRECITSIRILSMASGSPALTAGVLRTACRKYRKLHCLDCDYEGPEG